MSIIHNGQPSRAFSILNKLIGPGVFRSVPFCRPTTYISEATDQPVFNPIL